MKTTLLIMVIFLTAFAGNEPCKLSRLSSDAGFAAGVAVNIQKLRSEEKYRNLIISQFSSVTPEKSLKAAFVHPSRNAYEFGDVDYLIDFARSHNMRVHGHTLVWYKENPRWMERFKGGRSEWEQLLKDHIQTVVGHCKSYIKSWDVVNEALNDDGSLRDNIWLRNIGPEYIEKAFSYAAEADPSATLFYNDYDLESKPEKLAAALKMLAAIKAKGINVDGIGFQMHVSVASPYATDIIEAVMKAESKGFQVHYSEFDITLVRSGKLWMNSKHMLSLQAARVKDIVGSYRRLHPGSRYGITMWGLTDADSWLTDRNGRDKPLLFDEHYQPKPAYCAFVEALSE